MTQRPLFRTLFVCVSLKAVVTIASEREDIGTELRTWLKSFIDGSGD